MKKKKLSFGRAIENFRKGEAIFHNERVKVVSTSNPRIVTLEQQAQIITERVKKEGISGQ